MRKPSSERFWQGEIEAPRFRSRETAPGRAFVLSSRPGAPGALVAMQELIEFLLHELWRREPNSDVREMYVILRDPHLRKFNERAVRRGLRAIRRRKGKRKSRFWSGETP